MMDARSSGESPVNEIVPASGVSADAGDGQASLLNFVAAAVERPDIDVAKLDALLRMQREIAAEDDRRAFIRAMSAAQAEIQPVVRTAENTQTKSFYARLETVDAAIRPIYTRHGFSLSFDEEPTGDLGNMMIVCEVAHVAGYAKKYRLNAPPDVMGPKGTPTKTALHGRGSTVTFLRRYLTCNIFNVVLRDQDDDGARGGMVFVTPEQVREITNGLKETQADLAGFLDYMGAGSVEGIEARDYGKAMNAIAAKRRRLAKAEPSKAEMPKAEPSKPDLPKPDLPK